VSESRAAGAVIMHLDITGKRLAEQAIRRQAYMLDHIGQAVIATDMEGCITYVNRFAGELYGWPPEEMLGRDIIDVTVAKISHSQATASMARLRAGEIWSGEFLVQRRDGVIVPVLVTDSPLLGEQGELLGIIGIFIDITERKRAEETLLQNQAFLTMASRVGRLGAWALEMPSLALSWSDEVRAIHEMPPDYVATVDAGIDFYAPEFRETIRDAITGCMRDGKPFDVELQIITSSNRRLWTRSIGEARRDPDGVITRVQGAFQDIADRKAADARLREQAMLLDVAREAILVRDLDDHIIFWNKGAERGYGWSAAEALGQQSAELLKTDPAKFQEATAALLATGEWQGELVKSTRDGREIIVEARWTLVRDAEGRPKSILSINNDITDRKRMEQQFFRAQRLESVGTLASGLAHDLNNVLAPILMCSSMLRMGLSAEKVETLITTIESSATRGSQIINKVLTFGRGVDGDRVPLNLREIVGEIVQIASETFPKNIRTEHHIAKDLAGIVGDPTQWHQVLLNLAVNARDAMPDGGVFRITAENLLVDEHYASMSDGLTSGPHIVLR
jgi:PAS domain S-box-containing protein